MRLALIGTTVSLMVLSGAAACSRCSAGETAGEKEGDAPWTRRQPSFLVGVKGPWEGGYETTVLPVEVHREGLRWGETYEVASRQMLRPAVSVQGDRVWMGDGKTVRCEKPFGEGPADASVDVGDVPASLLGFDDVCIVGLVGEVVLVRLDGGAPRVETIHEDERTSRPVDFMVYIDEKTVMAVDDLVVPKWGYALATSSDGGIRYLYTVQLPSSNSKAKYVDAVAYGRALLVTSYIRRYGGQGHALDMWYVGMDEDYVGIMERDYGPRPPGWFAGESFSEWQGLGVIGDRIFVGATRRGILHLPVSLVSEGEPEEDGWSGIEQVDPGGACVDLVVDGDRLIVLVEEDPVTGDRGPQWIAVYGWDEDEEALVEQYRHPLEDRVLDGLEI